MNLPSHWSRSAACGQPSPISTWSSSFKTNQSLTRYGVFLIYSKFFSNLFCASNNPVRKFASGSDRDGGTVCLFRDMISINRLNVCFHGQNSLQLNAHSPQTTVWNHGSSFTTRSVSVTSDPLNNALSALVLDLEWAISLLHLQPHYVSVHMTSG